MDLRVKKTLINIKEAFFALRKKKPVGKITVKELSETAMINKATFYLHFKDIYDLSEKMQEEVLDRIVEESLKDNLDESRESYIRFTKNLISATNRDREAIEVLFSLGMNGDFVGRLNEKLKNGIFEISPHFRNDIEKSILISYTVYGAYNASLGEYGCSRDEKLSHICKFSEKLWV